MPGMRRREFVSAARRRGGCVAARGACAAAGNAGDRISRQPVTRCVRRRSAGSISRRSEGDRLRSKARTWQSNYRWAENQINRLPKLAAELVRRRLAVIVAGAPPAALAAKAATTTIPIVFGVGEDPVRIGLVASLARPDGNLTGINFFSSELAAKRLELLREMVPAAVRVAALVDPTFSLTESLVREVETTARALGLQIQVLNASTSGEINAAFATIVRERSDALFVGTGPFISSRSVQLALLAGRYGVPAIYWGASNC